MNNQKQVIFCSNRNNKNKMENVSNLFQIIIPAKKLQHQGP